MYEGKIIRFINDSLQYNVYSIKSI